MSCVQSLIRGVQSSCNALKKVGGINLRVYIGTLADLAAVTFGTDNAVTSFTFKAGKGFVKYIGKKDKNNTASDIEAGENVNVRNQSVNLAVYYETAAELAAFDELIDQEGVFVVVEHVSGTLEVFGINKTSFNSFGLKVTAATGTSGTVLNDSTAFNVTLSGGHTNLQLKYGPLSSLAANITALDAQTIHGNES